LKNKDLIEGNVVVSSSGQPGEFGWEAKRTDAKPKK
jgi:hypothetical protein